MKDMLLYKYIRGSKLYGTNLSDNLSDTDIGGIYLSSLEDIIDLGFNYKDEIKDEKGDLCYYELKKFLNLLIKSNPNILEALYVPEDKMIIKPHPILKPVFDNKELFLTKQCFAPFLGYAYTQIKKAKGLNKKVFKPMTERKDALDFCYTFYNGGSTCIKNWLEHRGLKQQYCGLAKINNMYEMYNVYYDFANQLGYRGIVGIEGDSNEVRLSSIPKGEKPICQLSFNKDGYSSHCRDYREYKEWEEKRNVIRFQSTLDAGKQYDLKNGMHMIRLMHMAKEIAQGEGFNVVRTWDKEMLMDIRSGKMDYEDLLNYAENLKKEIEDSIPTCSLPDDVDINFVNNLLIDIRKEQFKNIRL